MAGFELIDGEEERQFCKEVRDILENARSNAYKEVLWDEM